MKKQNLSLIFSFSLLLVVMLVLPYFSTSNYSIISNTTSHLAAQGSPHAWLMNLIFILLGLTSIVSGWKALETYLFHRAMLLIFGISLIGAGIFRHAPIMEGVSVDTFQDQMHSIFASITGFSFTLLAISAAFIVSTLKEKIAAIVVGLIASLLSYLMFELPEYMGIFQRLIFVTAFSWMIWFFEKLSANQTISEDQ